MSATDLGAVAAIYEEHTGVTPPDTWRGRVRGLLAREHDAVAIVAVDDDDALVGYILGEVRSWEFGSAPAGWVVGVGVAGSCQGEGVGRLLLHAALARFERAGVGAVRTMVRRDDVDVLRFFRGSGFTGGPYTQLELTA